MSGYGRCEATIVIRDKTGSDHFYGPLNTNNVTGFTILTWLCVWPTIRSWIYSTANYALRLIIYFFGDKTGSSHCSYGTVRCPRGNSRMIYVFIYSCRNNVTYALLNSEIHRPRALFIKQNVSRTVGKKNSTFVLPYYSDESPMDWNWCKSNHVDLTTAFRHYNLLIRFFFSYSNLNLWKLECVKMSCVFFILLIQICV